MVIIGLSLYSNISKNMLTNFSNVKLSTSKVRQETTRWILDNLNPSAHSYTALIRPPGVALCQSHYLCPRFLTDHDQLLVFVSETVEGAGTQLLCASLLFKIIVSFLSETLIQQKIYLCFQMLTNVFFVMSVGEQDSEFSINFYFVFILFGYYAVWFFI